MIIAVVIQFIIVVVVIIAKFTLFVIIELSLGAGVFFKLHCIMYDLMCCFPQNTGSNCSANHRAGGPAREHSRRP